MFILVHTISGNVEKAFIIRHHITNQSRCFGFVEFTNYDTINSVLKKKIHSIKDSQVDCRLVSNFNEMRKEKNNTHTPTTSIYTIRQQHLFLKF